MSNNNIWNRYKEYFGYPLIFSLVGSISATLTIYLFTDTNNAFDSFLSSTTAFSALVGYIIGNGIIAYKIYGKNYESLQILNSILKEFPIPLKKYALRNINESLKNINDKISSLSKEGLSGQTFGQKIQIIESIIEDLGNDLTKYWATTLDPPSRIMKESDRFLALQARTLKNINNKRRIVILNKNDLKREIIENTDHLIDFIDWHKKNNFQLLFLIDYDNKFVAETNQFLDHLRENEVVSDFAILGDDWVYGEVKFTSSGTTDDNRLLRLYGSVRSGREIIKDYVDLYSDLWEYWRAPRWPSMIPEQVRSECSRQIKKNKLNTDTIEYYKSIISNPLPPEFHSCITEHIKNSVDRIIAVDIAPIKSDLSDWIHRSEYNNWMEATVQAAHNGSNASRLYILKSPIESYADKQIIYDNIFSFQIKAGVHIWLASASDLWGNNIPVHDFILIDNKICLSLGWDENFLLDEISSEKNLENPNCFLWYDNIYNHIKDSGFSKCINNMKPNIVLDYLSNLYWQ